MIGKYYEDREVDRKRGLPQRVREMDRLHALSSAYRAEGLVLFSHGGREGPLEGLVLSLVTGPREGQRGREGAS